MNSDDDTRQFRGWVAPFGDPGIADRSHLPRAFRSVPRPSSPLSAKASTRCPSLRLILTLYPLRATLLVAAQNRRAQTARPNPGPPRRSRHAPMKTLLRTRTHASLPACARPCPPRSHDKLSLHPSINPPPQAPGHSARLLQASRASRCHLPHDRGASDGGGERDRTDDLLLAKQALSQLSYTPLPGARDQESGTRNPDP